MRASVVREKGRNALSSIVLAVLFASAASAPPNCLNAQPGLTRSRIVGYGVKHLEFSLPGPCTLDVLEVTLPNPYVSLESFRPDGLMTTSRQAALNDREGHRVIGAVNADFFSANGNPVGNQVANGLFAHGIASARSHLAVDTRHRPMIERLSFVGSVRTSSGASFPLSGVNVPRLAGALAFYTPYNGPSTSTTGGVEASVEFLEASHYGGDTALVKITIISAGGNAPIPTDGGVLSASAGDPAAFLSSFSSGDTLLLYLGFDPPLTHILQAVAGAGRILSSGRNVTDSMAHLEGLTSNLTDVRHPRTFVGFNRDTTRLFLCTVDGRQTGSVGMTFDEMASFFYLLGASDAFNLDGGGSTTMVVRGETVNSPSDPGGERAVANTLQMISEAPRGTLAHLMIRPGRSDTYQGQPVRFIASGTNEYCDSAGLPPDLTWAVDARLGVITDGYFTPGAVDDSGWVYALWGQVRDSARVVVHTFVAIAPRSPGYVMIPGEAVSMRVLGSTLGGATVALQDTLCAFTPSSPVLGVDERGIVSAAGVGTAVLGIQYGGLNSQAMFDCTGNDTTIIADAMDRLDDWSIIRVNTDELETGVAVVADPLSTRKVVLIDHSHLPGPKGVDFATVLPLAGRPDSIAVGVYGSGNADTVRVTVSDRNGVLFSLPSTTVVDWSSEWRDIVVRADPGGSSGPVFPITIIHMQVRFGTAGESGGFVQGLLYLADVRAHYPRRSGTAVTPQSGAYPARFELSRNYPNPFNPTTVIRYRVREAGNVRLAVFDLLGRELAVLVNERKSAGTYEATFDAIGTASGVYLYRLTADGFVQTHSMVVIR